MQTYTTLKITCATNLFDILAAELYELGFDGFMEHEDGLEGYIDSSLFKQEHIYPLLAKYNIGSNQIIVKTIAQQNWNAEWERNFEPVFIKDKVVVKAPFHNTVQNFPYVITIQPKTSFGTGHHQTTNLMIQLMLDTDFKQKNVFDFGSGTGILAIFASLLGSNQVQAIDIDNWAAENIIENMRLNNLQGIVFKQCNLQLFEPNIDFDIILANINKNILLESFNRLNALLKQGGTLLISGFYVSDLQVLKKNAATFGLQLKNWLQMDDWCAARLEKTK
jgi:ribosomal protein L11 methyltransferase